MRNPYVSPNSYKNSKMNKDIIFISNLNIKQQSKYNIRAMGNWVASLFSRLNPKKDFKILMVGLDNAGKTTILYKVSFIF